MSPLSIKQKIAQKASRFLIENLPDGSRMRDKRPVEGPRTLTDDDLSEFERAATARPRTRPRSKTPKITKPKSRNFVDHLKFADYFRYRRVLRDLRWVRKQAAKQGIHENDIPWKDMR